MLTNAARSDVIRRRDGIKFQFVPGCSYMRRHLSTCAPLIANMGSDSKLSGLDDDYDIRIAHARDICVVHNRNLGEGQRASDAWLILGGPGAAGLLSRPVVDLLVVVGGCWRGPC